MQNHRYLIAKEKQTVNINLISNYSLKFSIVDVEKSKFDHEKNDILILMPPGCSDEQIGIHIGQADEGCAMPCQSYTAESEIKIAQRRGLEEKVALKNGQLSGA